MNEFDTYVSDSINDLFKRFPWLIEKTAAVFSLFSECRSKQEADLITELLERFQIINEEERNIGYMGMAQYISSVFDQKKTLIVSMTRDEDPDSGQKVIADIRTFLIGEGIRTKDYRNRFEESPIKLSKYSKVIVLDEFLGSGKTVRKRAESLLAKHKGITEIHFCLLAGMEWAVSDLKNQMDKRVHIYCHYSLKRGIWGYNSGESLVNKTITMLHLENRFSPKVGSALLTDFSFGYGNAQSLVAFGKYNIPNSVFPIFWWPNENYGRNTLFCRDEPRLVT